MKENQRFMIQELDYKVAAAGSIEVTRAGTKVVTTAIKAVSDVIIAVAGKKQ